MALAVIVLLGVSTLAFVHFHKSNKVSNLSASTASSSNISQITTPPASAPSTVLVFQPSRNSSNSRTSIVGLNGKVLHTFSSNASSNTYTDSGFPIGNPGLLEGSFLITTDKLGSSFAILTADGKVTNIASSLNSLLAASTLPNSPRELLSSVISAGKGTFYALESSSDTTAVKLVKIDLLAGTKTTLLTAESTEQGYNYNSPLWLVTVSRDGKTAYLISNDAKLGSTNSPGISLVACNTSTGNFTTKALPDGIDPEGASVSKDGK